MSNHNQLFRSLANSGVGKVLAEYCKELATECESAKGKKDWAEVQGGLIAAKIIQEKLIDKLVSSGQKIEGSDGDFI